jgi:chaperone required for assembly of F1-ATPase
MKGQVYISGEPVTDQTKIPGATVTMDGKNVIIKAHDAGKPLTRYPWVTMLNKPLHLVITPKSVSAAVAAILGLLVAYNILNPQQQVALAGVIAVFLSFMDPNHREDTTDVTVTGETVSATITDKE